MFVMAYNNNINKDPSLITLKHNQSVEGANLLTVVGI